MLSALTLQPMGLRKKFNRDMSGDDAFSYFSRDSGGSSTV